MKNSDMPAMPSDVKDVYEAMTGSSDSWGKAALGLTKREMVAMHIASGFAADNKITADDVVKWSIEVTDKLLSELERTCQKS